MKKLLFVLCALVILLIVFFPLTVSFVIRQGFAHPEKPWASKAVFGGARLEMLLQRPATAREVFQAGLQQFPNAEGAARATYRVAVCYEREGNIPQAIVWYGRFLKQWPGHIWADQARHSIANLKALQD